MAFESDLNRFIETRNQTLQMAGGLRQDLLDYAPAPGKWSVGEVLDHLVLAETLYRNDIAELIERAQSGREAVVRRSFGDVDVSIAGIPKSLLSVFEVPMTLFTLFTPVSFRTWMTRSRAIPAKNPQAAQPVKGKSAAELRSALQDSIRQTEILFRSNPGLDYSRMFHRHPLMGLNNVLQLLAIMTAHEARHQQQIRLILEAR